jgi:Co/Zn/Cd efflux system component
MKNENDELDQMFANLTDQLDIYTTQTNHEQRFLNKLKPSKFKMLLPVAIAASIALLFCLTILHPQKEKEKDFKFASIETKQTDSVFTVMIERELEKIKEKKSPENEKIIADALLQMKRLDKDYEKIMQELEANGESKPIIKALISNLQIRISFLQEVLQHIENNEKLKNISNEQIM